MHIWEKTLGSSAIPLKRKQYAREFNANNIIFDALYLTASKEDRYNLRNPLSTMIDYKGFRAIAIACLPINPENGMSLGFDQEGRLNILDSQLKTELQYVGDVLNLDEMKTRVKKSNIEMGGIDSEQHKVEVDI